MTYKEKLQVILPKLREVRKENPQLTFQYIYEQTGISISTLSRIFSEDSNRNYFYAETIQPIVKLILGVDIEDIDEKDLNTAEAVLRIKDETIDELHAEMDIIKASYEKKILLIEEKHQNEIDRLHRELKAKDDIIDRVLSLLDDRNKSFDYINQKYYEVVSRK